MRHLTVTQTRTVDVTLHNGGTIEDAVALAQAALDGQQPAPGEQWVKVEGRRGHAAHPYVQSVHVDPLTVR